MRKRLQTFLDSLGTKYQAEPDLHEQICRKIRSRLASFSLTAEEFAHLEKVILRHVEETYKRWLTARGDLREAKQPSAPSSQTTQQNLEKLLEVKSCVENLQELIRQHKATWGIVVLKKKNPQAPKKPMNASWLSASEQDSAVRRSSPFDFSSN